MNIIHIVWHIFTGALEFLFCGLFWEGEMLSFIFI